mgnify:CR=1 FL=1
MPAGERGESRNHCCFFSSIARVWESEQERKKSDFVLSRSVSSSSLRHSLFSLPLRFSQVLGERESTRGIRTPSRAFSSISVTKWFHKKEKAQKTDEVEVLEKKRLSLTLSPFSAQTPEAPSALPSRPRRPCAPCAARQFPRRGGGGPVASSVVVEARRVGEKLEQEEFFFFF